jgi:DNA primase large subunit
MRLITSFELAGLYESELRGLLRHAFNELAKSDPRSHERRNALASIENIKIELHSRTLPPNG